jgi:hypothetical protein
MKASVQARIISALTTMFTSPTFQYTEWQENEATRLWFSFTMGAGS